VRAFRRHDARDDGGVEHRPFAGAVTAGAQRERYGARQTNAGLGDRNALRHGLRANVYHGGAVTGIQMREAAARHQPPM
jgi:hypothetical protein